MEMFTRRNLKGTNDPSMAQENNGANHRQQSGTISGTFPSVTISEHDSTYASGGMNMNSMILSKHLNRRNDSRKNALHGRLQESVVFELHKDGGREYHSMSLRALYDYVLKVITTKKGDEDVQNSNLPQPLSNQTSRRRNVSINNYDTSPQQQQEQQQQQQLSQPLNLSRQSQFFKKDSQDQTVKASNLSPLNIQHTTTLHSSTQEQHPQQTFCQSNIGNTAAQGPSSNTIDVNKTILPTTKSQRTESQQTDQTQFQQPEQTQFQQSQLTKPPSPSPNPQTMENNALHHGITLRERLGGYLHPRDMRRLLTPFSSSNEAQLIVRRHVMLLNFDPLRAIVLRDRLLVIVPDGADSLLHGLDNDISGGKASLEQEVFGERLFTYHNHNNTTNDMYSVLTHIENDVHASTNTNEELDFVEIENKPETMEHDIQPTSLPSTSSPKIDPNASVSDNDTNDTDSVHTIRAEEYDIFEEWDDIQAREWIDMPFELHSVDTILSTVCKMLSNDCDDLHKYIKDVIQELGAQAMNSSDHVQERLRTLKDDVKEMEGRLQGFVRAMNLILNNDEDMALMNLSRLITHPERFIQPVSQNVLTEESDEPELILEVYLQQALSEVNALELIKGKILSTEELVSLKMDVIRNRILYVNLLVSVASLCVACASFVGSIMGMNLINHAETSANAFWIVTFLTIGLCTILFFATFYVMMKTNIIPSMLSRKKKVNKIYDDILSHR
eukprot:CAMPEP_0184872332 /NCGR_PEP_ID=MMETSP0580-20130426/41231_1 /TAXON_ID=1118495 /ORGANISM="Dactyliosolen fragilissimus" /LENGTH=727 /DNA_ID=CAMNT_0027375119 /DNA_START=69 /DNA_END=2249 /DNA_ORIENTATION=+